MSYVKQVLLPGEKVVHIATIHWIIFLPGMLLTGIGGIITFLGNPLLSLLPWSVPILNQIVAGIGLVISVVGLALLLGAIVRQSSTELAITNQRLIAKYGFVTRATFEIMMHRVTGVNFDQNISGRLFGYGTILVHGTGGDISPFDVISNPQIFQRALMYALELEKNSNPLKNQV